MTNGTKCLSGQVFGRFTALVREGDSWVCECSCGGTKKVLTGNLTRGRSRSCGCLQKELAAARKTIDLTGRTFGRLTVISRSYKVRRGITWLCECSCGTVKAIVGEDLSQGDTRSCGCLQRDLSAARAAELGRSQRGVLCPAWRGGITPETQRQRNSERMQFARAACFRRDDYTCQACGERGGRLNADHILPWSTHEELRFDLNNLRTLCVQCHRKTPTYGSGARQWNTQNSKY